MHGFNCAVVEGALFLDVFGVYSLETDQGYVEVHPPRGHLHLLRAERGRSGGREQGSIGDHATELHL